MKLVFDELPAGLELRECIPEAGDTELIIPEGVVFIHDAALRRLTDVVRLTLPSTVRLDSGSVFSSMAALAEITVSPDHPDLTDVDGVLCSRKHGALSLLRYPAGRSDKRYDVPEQVRTIGRYAFLNAAHLETVVLHEDVWDVGEGAFCMCKKLRFAYLRCKHLRYLRESVFRFCNRLSVVRFGGFVEHVQDRAFDGCVSLDRIHFPDGLTELGVEVFACCSSLRAVDFPPSLCMIGRDVFYDCGQLESVRCAAEAARLIPSHHDVIEIIPSL